MRQAPVIVTHSLSATHVNGFRTDKLEGGDRQH